MGKQKSRSPEAELYSFSSNASIKPSMCFWLDPASRAGCPGLSKHPHVLPLHRSSGWATATPYHGPAGGQTNALTLPGSFQPIIRPDFCFK